MVKTLQPHKLSIKDAIQGKAFEENHLGKPE